MGNLDLVTIACTEQASSRKRPFRYATLRRYSVIKVSPMQAGQTFTIQLAYLPRQDHRHSFHRTASPLQRNPLSVRSGRQAVQLRPQDSPSRPSRHPPHSPTSSSMHSSCASNAQLAYPTSRRCVASICRGRICLHQLFHTSKWPGMLNPPVDSAGLATARRRTERPVESTQTSKSPTQLFHDAKKIRIGLPLHCTKDLAKSSILDEWLAKQLKDTITI